ncbi:glycosyltransferase family 2 protein [Paenibacillus sp. WLX2291]|uniref:glycosyltransferase family 2 protein n=1 Tax=Paenibacillus sp. WLX2291 TaxID=3296934 RepID=UPI0039840612
MTDIGMLQVLMSTYNGAKYIEAQLDSILSQPYQPIRILIRDDGSTDNTIAIIHRYQEQHPDVIQLIQGDNVGVVPSFWSLMQHADQTAEYFCFCDQDDVWMTHKAEQAVQLLSTMQEQQSTNLHTPSSNLVDKHKNEHSLACMICTDTQLTDGQLNPTAIWPGMPNLQASFYNALIQNIAVGATVSFNRAALQLLMNKSHSVNINNLQMHDWWMYLVISCFGNVHFEHTPSIYYRQHGGNAVGGEWTIAQKLKKKWNSFLKHRGDKSLLVKQAEEFKRIYGEQMCDKEMIRQVNDFIAPRSTFWSRVRYLRTCRLFRQSITEQLLFRFLILIGYI